MKYLSLLETYCTKVISSFLVCLVTLSTKSQTPLIEFNPIINTGLPSPVDIVNAGDGTNRMFIVEQSGRIVVYTGGIIQPTPFLDISSSGFLSAGGERGLLSLAFSPDYATNGFFYIYYTNAFGDIEVSRLKVRDDDSSQADVSSRKIVLSIPHRTYGNHNGGKLNFGPDKSLYFATGDGGSGDDPDNNAQNADTLLGKMIRIMVNDSTDVAPYYSIPPDNPYVGTAGVKPEILAMGLRNPYRWSFDRNGAGPWDIWIGDVGQNTREEIDYRPGTNFTPGAFTAANYGWRCKEGFINNPNISPACSVSDYVPPILDYGRSDGQTVIGGMVYRGSAYPGLVGWYIAVDYFSSNGWLIKPDGAGGVSTNMQTGLPLSITGFGESENRELYAVSRNNLLYRVQLAGFLPIKLKEFTATLKNNSHVIKWKTETEDNVERFEVQLSMNGKDFQTIAIVHASNNKNGSEYSYIHESSPVDVFYRLKTVDRDAKAEYSNVVKLLASKINSVTIMPSFINRDGHVKIKMSRPFKLMEVLDINGKVMLRKTLNPSVTELDLPFNGFATGLYIIRLSDQTSRIQKIISVH